MDLANRESRIRRYIHTGATLRHLPAGSEPYATRCKFAGEFVRLLIEETSHSQTQKWRRYAEIQKRGYDSSSRVELS